MTTVTHKFVSPKSEQTDPTLVGPNEWNAVHIANSTDTQTLLVSDYNFSAFQLGSAVTANITNTITISNVPLGINGTDVNHYLYINDGANSETVLITGGTATSGGSNQTLTFTPTHNHTSSTTITSATGGVAEAQQVIFSLPNKNGKLRITQPITFYAGVYGSAVGLIIFEGIPDAILITRNTGYIGDLFHANTTQWLFRDIGVTTLAIPTAGSTINAGSTTLIVYNLFAVNEFQIIKLAGQAILRDILCLQTDYTNTPSSAIEVDFGGSILISGLNIQATDHNNSKLLRYGINVNGTDSILVTNSLITGCQYGILFNAGNNYIVNIQVNNTSIIDNWNGIFFSDPTNLMTDILFNNVIINGDNTGSATGNGSGVGVFIGFGANNSINASNISFNNCHITGFYGSGVWVQSIGSDISFNGCLIWGNNVGVIAGEHGIKGTIVSATRLSITCCQIYSNGGSGIALLNANNDVQITGNIFYNNTVSPLVLAGITTGIISDNKGISDTTGSITISTGTASFPFNPHISFSSAAAVSAVTGLWSGASGTFINTNGSPGTWTAGATIGNTLTPAQNIPVIWWFDGTKIWLK